MGKDRKQKLELFVDAWTESSTAKLKELNPDIVVGDILARCVTMYADKLGIPRVVNNPAGPLPYY